MMTPLFLVARGGDHECRLPTSGTQRFDLLRFGQGTGQGLGPNVDGEATSDELSLYLVGRMERRLTVEHVLRLARCV